DPRQIISLAKSLLSRGMINEFSFLVDTCASEPGNLNDRRIFGIIAASDAVKDVATQAIKAVSEAEANEHDYAHSVSAASAEDYMWTLGRLTWSSSAARKTLLDSQAGDAFLDGILHSFDNRMRLLESILCTCTRPAGRSYLSWFEQLPVLQKSHNHWVLATFQTRLQIVYHLALENPEKVNGAMTAILSVNPKTKPPIEMRLVRLLRFHGLLIDALPRNSEQYAALEYEQSPGHSVLGHTIALCKMQCQMREYMVIALQRLDLSSLPDPTSARRVLDIARICGNSQGCPLDPIAAQFESDEKANQENVTVGCGPHVIRIKRHKSVSSENVNADLVLKKANTEPSSMHRISPSSRVPVSVSQLLPPGSIRPCPKLTALDPAIAPRFTSRSKSSTSPTTSSSRWIWIATGGAVLVSGGLYQFSRNRRTAPPDLSLSDPERLSTAISYFNTILPASHISTNPADLTSHSQDVSPYLPTGRPAIVLYPSTEDQVSKILQKCNELKVPIVAYGAGTSLEGQTVAGRRAGVVVDLSRMNAVLEVYPEDMQAVVQPGISWNDLNHELEPLGLFFAPDPGETSLIHPLYDPHLSLTPASPVGTQVWAPQ
ncbi:D-lactate ferricytochrome c oxidoreductase, partial [Gonapodya sp. JEL0774]